MLARSACRRAARQLVTPEIRRVGDKLGVQVRACNNTVATCQMLECHYSLPAREKIADMQKAGMGDQQIVDAFVKERGIVALAAPPSEGFNLLAGSMPFIGIGFGLAVIAVWIEALPQAQAGAVSRVDGSVGRTLPEAHRTGNGGSRLMFLTLAIGVTAADACVHFVWFVAKDLPETAAPPPYQHLEERKAAIYENLRDLQFEYRVGKLSDADYERTKKELQAELATVLAEIDKLKGARPPPAPQACKAGAERLPALQREFREAAEVLRRVRQAHGGHRMRLAVLCHCHSSFVLGSSRRHRAQRDNWQAAGRRDSHADTPGERR